MKREVISDVELRAHFDRNSTREFVIPEGAIITPAARDFLREQNIELRGQKDSIGIKTNRSMTVDPIPQKEGKSRYVDHTTGRDLSEKPEHMTHLRGNRLISKRDPRIAFRGRLDSLMASMISAQVEVYEAGYGRISTDIGELLDLTRLILAAEVKDEPLTGITFQGMDSEKIRYDSQHPEEVFGIMHPIPCAKAGRTGATLNRLRTEVREVELAAMEAFCDSRGNLLRPDIIEALNRLSSCCYILMLRLASGFYKKSKYLKVPVEVSARHVHLTKEALEALFGEGFEMSHRKDLRQPGQFATNERVKLVSEKGEIDRVSVLGPVRDHCQVELSKTDAIALKLSLPVNLSGNYEGAKDILLVGPKGSYLAKESALIAMAHIHMTEADAKAFGVTNGEKVGVTLETDRAVTLENVIIRVDSPEKASLAMHIDFDEANASGVTGNTKGIIRKR